VERQGFGAVDLNGKRYVGDDSVTNRQRVEKMFHGVIELVKKEAKCQPYLTDEEVVSEVMVKSVWKEKFVDEQGIVDVVVIRIKMPFFRFSGQIQLLIRGDPNGRGCYLGLT
jgi:hypothetical protein